MPGKLRVTTLCFHISAVLYILLGIAFGLFFALLPAEELGALGPILGVFFGFFCIVLAVAVEFVIWGLRQLKYWAWITGIIVAGLYIPSAFILLGALGLWGLLDAETQAAFQSARLSAHESASDSNQNLDS